jgi:PncC family amidohydrolase
MLTKARKLGEIMKRRDLFLAVAESCTGGMIGAAITDVPGASAWFKGGVIAYSNQIKKKVLGVSASVLQAQGAVSAEVVEEMARGVAKLCKTECSLAVSGIAGPEGGSREKPVGLVFIGIYVAKQVRSYRYNFKGNRERIRIQAVDMALKNLVELLIN